jgi:hypothetical protein
MSHSARLFDRWKPRESSTWVFRVFKKHNIELLRLYTAFETSRRFTYKNLRGVGAWSDSPATHLAFAPPLGADQFVDMRDWSNAFNEFENWANLNALVSISSNLETYLATVVSLALSSDVGTLYGTSQKIDGIGILKHGHEGALSFDEHVTGCTKGDWNVRLAAYLKYFGRAPKFFASNIAPLEQIRRIRNSVAHAFGRDIDASREHQRVRALPVERLSRDSLLALQKIAWKLAKAIDAHLHEFHIGEYQALVFYHRLYPELRKDLHPSMRAMALKKRLGGFGATSAGKEFCKGLVAYYESL